MGWGDWVMEKMEKKREREEDREEAIFGGGCFWCLEAVFQDVSGVLEVLSGYSGGNTKNPDYRTVCSGRSGHAEVCQISYDPHKISYGELLKIFFQTHDPTTINRQGNDVGSQYRSVIFYCNKEQKESALKHIEELERSKVFKNPIVTEIKALTKFYPAEGWHQNYFKNNLSQPYCSFVVRPKVEKFRRQFPQLQQ